MLKTIKIELPDEIIDLWQSEEEAISEVKKIIIDSSPIIALDRLPFSTLPRNITVSLNVKANVKRYIERKGG